MHAKQIMDLRNALYYLDILIKTKGFMFGGNSSAIDSLITLHAKMHKWCVALSFYQVREVIAKIFGCHFIPGEINLVGIHSKHYIYVQI